MKIIKILAALLCAVILAAAVPVLHISAEDAAVSLVCIYNQKPIAGMRWRIYLVGEQHDDAIVLTGEYRNDRVNLTNLSGDGMRTAATTLESIIIRNKRKHLAESNTDEQGTVTFSGLEKGVYLAIPRIVYENNMDYTSAPVLFSVRESGQETILPKIYSTEVDVNEGRRFTVRKVWDDRGENDVDRPVNVTVDLYKDGELADTVILSAENNWKHTWAAKNDSSEWRVAERDIPVHYTVIIDYNSSQYVIKNSYEPEQTTTVTGTTSNTRKTTAVISDTKRTDATVPPAAVTTVKPELPQTGQLWWPVIPLATGGILMIALGIATRKKENES